MGILFDQDTVTEFYENEIYENGKAEGMQQGMKQGMLKVLIDMVKDKLLSVADAAKRLGVSEKEFMRLSKA
ncbi:MAG: hypothetical protein J6M39_07805 [Lachnospiraceae bacterium]|nr:hypothetical protein [Lachnospiraceae bacterium]